MAYPPPLKVPTYQDLLGMLQKVRGENRDLKEFNRNLHAAESDHQARVAELEAALKALYALVQGEYPSLLEDDHHDGIVRSALHLD
jgi:hypothetical protein